MVYNIFAFKNNALINKLDKSYFLIIRGVTLELISRKEIAVSKDK